MLTTSQSFSQASPKEIPARQQPTPTDCGTFMEYPPLVVPPLKISKDSTVKPGIIFRGGLRTNPVNKVFVILNGTGCTESPLEKKFPRNKIIMVDVLKGGQAATLFGADGVNGAIVITSSLTEMERKRFLRKGLRVN